MTSFDAGRFDLTTPRIGTELMSPVTVTYLSVKVIAEEGDTLATSHRSMSVKKSSIRIDTSHYPSRLWAEFDVKANVFNRFSNKDLQSLHIRLDSIELPRSGATRLSVAGDPATGTGVTVKTLFWPADTIFSADCGLDFYDHSIYDTTSLNGTLVINCTWSGNTHAYIVAEFNIARQ